MSYTAKRLPAVTPMPEGGSLPPKKEPRGGVVECSLCGTRFRPATRRSPHPDSPECRAQQVVNDYAKRGWTQLTNTTMASIVEEAGAPLEWAMGAYHIETRAVNDRGKTEDVKVQHNVPFSPEPVLRAALLLCKIRMPSGFRRRGIAAIWNRPEALEALDSMRRLGNDSQVRQLISTYVNETVPDAGQKIIVELEFGEHEEPE
jgi:hypothetical protein